MYSIIERLKPLITPSPTPAINHVVVSCYVVALQTIGSEKFAMESLNKSVGKFVCFIFCGRG